MIKIFQSTNIKDLELKANKFIGHKKIQHVGFTATSTPGKFFDTNNLFLLVEYEARRGTGRWDIEK
jgi:hypothetical protein